MKFPKSAVASQEDGIPGGNKPVWEYEKLIAADALDRMVEEFGGDEKKALEEYDRQIEYYDKQHEKQQGRRIVYSRQY